MEIERENREMWRQNIQTIKIATESNLNIFLSELTRDTTANKNPAENLSRGPGQTQERKEPLGLLLSAEGSNMLAICYREYKMIIS